MDLPGYAKENVDIQLKNNHINVAANSEERGDVKKSISLPSNYDKESVTAKLENGILEIFIVKEKQTVRKIELQ